MNFFGLCFYSRGRVRDRRLQGATRRTFKEWWFSPGAIHHHSLCAPFGVFGRAREDAAAISATMVIGLDLAPSLTQLKLDQLRHDYLYRCCYSLANLDLN